MRAIVAIFLLLISSTFSCQNSRKEQAIKQEKIQINIGSEPNTLDPRKSRSLKDKILVQMLFEGLTRVNQVGQLELALADSIISEDNGCLYIVSLKESYWSNGDRVMPEDFLSTWTTALMPEFPSPNAYQLFCIKNAKDIKLGIKSPQQLGVHILDEKTFQIELEGPLPYFLDLVSSPIFFPVHRDMKTEVVTFSGPFCLEEWVHNDHIEVVKNARYWDAETVCLNSLYMTMVEEDTEMRMFELGELDWAGSPISTLSVDLIPALRRENLLCSAPMNGTYFFRLNTAIPPLDNVHIRKALALAIDRQSIVDHVTQGGQKVALGLVPGYERHFVDHDVIQSKSLWKKGLEEAGFSLESLPKISLLYASSQRNHLIAQAVQRCWKEVLGLEVSLEVNEPSVCSYRLGRQEYQIAAGSWIADYDDAENFLEVFKYSKDSTNNTNWENASYKKLLDDSRKETGVQRACTLARCEQILMNEMPIIPIYYCQSLYVKNPRLKDVVLSPLGILDFRWAYVDASSNES